MELDNVKAKASFVSWSKTHPVLAVGTDKVIMDECRAHCFFIIRETKRRFLPWGNIVRRLFQEIGIRKGY
jgi:hypothetical protein